MAKAPTFKYTVTAEITTSVPVKVKDLKREAQAELSYIVIATPDGGTADIEVGKVTVVAQ